MSDAVFLAVCFVIDFVFSVIFPSDYAMQGFIVVPCAVLCGMLSVVKHKNWIHGIYLAFITGLLSDFFCMNSSMSFALIFVVSALIMRLWEKHLSSSLFEQAILLISTIFIKEGLLYLTQLTSGSFQMSLSTWLLYRCIPTLIANVVIVLIVLGMQEIKADFDDKQERNKRKEESMFWKMFK